MHAEIGNHTLIHERRPYEIAGERDALCLTDLARNGKLHLPGQLRILANFDGLDRIPEVLAVGTGLGCMFGQHH